MERASRSAIEGGQGTGKQTMGVRIVDAALGERARRICTEQAAAAAAATRRRLLQKKKYYDDRVALQK